ncbi:hypothetical protein HK098_003662 [Nowakowskiella sp. JEL0407]|nr:hypothetical protein HK098_003662 [Nowakowskiella sp. JEL0407]
MNFFLQFPAEILYKILHLLKPRLALKSGSGRQTRGTSKGFPAILNLAQTCKPLFVAVVKYSGLFESRYIKGNSLSTTCFNNFPSQTIFNNCTFLAVDLKYNSDENAHNKIDLPSCESLISLFVNCSVPNRSRDFSSLTASPALNLSKLAEFRNLKTLNIAKFLPCRTFSWTDLIGILNLLNLEAFSFGIEPRSKVLPSDIETQSFASALDSQSRLVYLSLSMESYRTGFFLELLSKLEKKKRLSVRLNVPSEYSSFLITNSKFGTFLINENRNSIKKTLTLKTTAEPTSATNLYVQECDHDYEILRSYEKSTSLQSLCSAFGENRFIRSIHMILRNCKDLKTLLLDFDGGFDEEQIDDDEGKEDRVDFALVQSVFSEIAVSPSIRTLTIPTCSKEYIYTYLAKVLEENTSIEELTFYEVQDPFKDKTLAAILPLLVEKIKNNPSSRIKSIASDIHTYFALMRGAYHPGIVPLYRYEMDSRRIVLFPMDVDSDIDHDFVGDLFTHLVLFWDSGDCTVSRVVLDNVPNSIWKYDFTRAVLSSVICSFIDGEYCMMYNGIRA